MACSMRAMSRRRLQIAAAAEDQMILRIEPDHRHFVLQVSRPTAAKIDSRTRG